MSLNKPNLIGIGGHKCASTWLYSLLESSNDVYMSNPKELGFFIKRPQVTFDKYLSFFKNKEKYKYRGEFTSYYLYDDDSHLLMEKYLDDYKCIAIVREPIERALSQIKHGIRNKIIQKPYKNIIDLKSLLEMIEEYPIIVSRSLYYKSLYNFHKLLGEERLLILNYDEISSTECKLKLEKFLNIKFTEYHKLKGLTIGKGIVPKFEFLEAVRKKVYLLFRTTPLIVPLIRKSGISRLYRKLNKGNELNFSEDALNYLSLTLANDWNKTKELIQKNNG